jgi:hypothetical protein
VVVVVVGPGITVCSDVVVVLCWVVPLLQAPSNRTTAAREGTMIFFMEFCFLDCSKTIHGNPKGHFWGMGY